ncbi:Serine/threonine-protein kinase cds1 [Cercospora beticola]|uniref:non-specific serine/threonine protein kinase n=1 Tax=Cercospora beticola TaxID=122368 RepID=A0A2G5HJS0_CERBT|nr:Serine/threonine-protein kinase cds1 [Cercospora beticola]PIA92755.1 Serine/threonine-protein kinase cds1 [Cercospora beticola]WPB01726.1 hypothetical protein RHO25_006357 [Cercospora beticola]
MPRAADLVLLARLEAQLTETLHGVFTKHSDGELHTVWRRDPRPLGRGGFGEVYREECIDGLQRGSVRAVKLIQKPNARQLRGIDFSRELEAIARFSQPQYEAYFAKSFGWFETSSTVFIAMEFLEHGDLQRCCGNPIPEREMQAIASQVLGGLSFMHSQGYAHRDLKPQNLIVCRPRPRWHIKIADFGLSKRVAESFSSLHTQAGTQGYMAPEVMGLLDDDDDSDDGITSSYTTAVDIWALGVITFYMLTGQLPFPVSDQRPLKKYVRGKTLFPVQKLHEEEISDAGCTWIETCMAPSPLDRPSAGYSRRHDWPMGAKAFDASTEELQSSVASSGMATASWTATDSAYDSGNHPPVAEDSPKSATLNNTAPVALHMYDGSSEITESNTTLPAKPRSSRQRTRARPLRPALSFQTTSETSAWNSADTIVREDDSMYTQIPVREYLSTGWADHVTLSADNEVIGTICGTDDATQQQVRLCLWSTETGKSLLKLDLELPKSHIRDKNTFGSLVIGPGALSVALSTDDARIHVWHLAHNGTEHQSPPTSIHVDPSYSSYRNLLEFSRDGKYLMHYGKTTCVYDAVSMSLVGELQLDLDESCRGSQTITPDSQFLKYTPRAQHGSSSGEPHLLSIKTGRDLEKKFYCGKYSKGVSGYSQPFHFVDQKPLFSLDGRRMCVMSFTCGLHLWDLSSGNSLLDDDVGARNSLSWTHGLYKPALSRDGRFFAGLKPLYRSRNRSMDQLELTICNLDTGVRVSHLFPVALLCKTLFFHPNGQLVFAGWYMKPCPRPSGPGFIRTLMLGNEQINVSILIFADWLEDV